jgi:hypothetical protein
VAKIAVFTIATNKYFQFWESMVESADKYLFLDDELTFHVFTNINIEASVFNKKLKRTSIIVHKIPNLVWPNATLFRYKYISEYGEDLKYDYFLHIDADMLIVPHINLTIAELLNGSSIALVSHPGYWRVSFPKNLSFYCRNFKYAIKDMILIVKYGNIGTWSKNKKSKAYVKRYNRKKYYCGAVWFGEKSSILRLANELHQYTNFDLEGSNIPTWNDESYLNNWASKNNFRSLTPSFCYEESYKNLEYLNPIIIALDKSRYENS